jgi:hypothetical protein
LLRNACRSSADMVRSSLRRATKRDGHGRRGEGEESVGGGTKNGGGMVVVVAYHCYY